MNRTTIDHVAAVLPDRIEADCRVAWSGGKIESVGQAPAGELEDSAVDGSECFLVPGFIDLHIHGMHEFLADSGPEALEGLCRVLPRYGVTGFLPTLCPRPKGEDRAYLLSIAGCQPPGADILGFHLEGPFLTLTGALPPEALGEADPGRVRDLIDAASPRRAIFSIAPDFPGISDLLPLMTANGAPVFITHTRADVAQTEAAIAAGACHATHFFDVFPCPEVREGGVRPCGAVEVILADPRATVDFILDGEHVETAAVRLALHCKGADGVCLITDANVGAGLPPGRYTFGSAEIEFSYPGGPARITRRAGSTGGLAGSGLTMDRALRNAIEMLGVELPVAARMAGANPARVLGLQDRKGLLREGFDADLVLLDGNLNVLRTWVGGREVYRAE